MCLTIKMNMNPMENITQYFKPHIFHYCEPFHSRPAKSFFSGLCHHLSLSPAGAINHFSVYRFNIILRQSSCYQTYIESTILTAVYTVDLQQRWQSVKSTKHLPSSSSSSSSFLFLSKTYILQLDWPAKSYASLGSPVYQ